MAQDPLDAVIDAAISRASQKRSSEEPESASQLDAVINAAISRSQGLNSVIDRAIDDSLSYGDESPDYLRAIWANPTAGALQSTGTALRFVQEASLANPWTWDHNFAAR